MRKSALVFVVVSTIFYALFLCLIFFSCKNDVVTSGLFVECPVDIAGSALLYASEYSKADTEYAWGGQDMLRSVKVDCSGLIVNCYKYAVENTQYYLPFDDAAVINFYQDWTVETDFPRPGDLIFMGDDKNMPSHMAIFCKRENGTIYFIDSTLKPEEEIDGVSQRSYVESDPRFLSFGIVLLGKN
jgi:hypothetical protein